MNWLADNYGSMDAVDDPSRGPSLHWTADEMADWDEDDFAAANLAMERDMADRAREERFWSPDHGPDGPERETLEVDDEV